MLAEQCAAERRLVADEHVHRVCFLRTDDFQLFRETVAVVKRDGRADANFVGIADFFADDFVVTKDGFQLGNAGVGFALLVAGFVVFAVFRKVAEAAGFLDKLGDLVNTRGFKPGEIRSAPRRAYLA